MCDQDLPGSEVHSFLINIIDDNITNNAIRPKLKSVSKSLP